MLGQDRQLTDDHGQLAVALDVEPERHLVLAGLLCLGDVLVVKRVVGGRFLDGIKREHDVLGRDRFAVVKARALAQLERGGGMVVRVRHPFRDQAVGGGFLVRARRHQLVINQTDAGRDRTLDGEGIEGIEAAERPLAHAPALGRVRINPIELLVFGTEFRGPNQGNGMLLDRLVRGESRQLG